MNRITDRKFRKFGNVKKSEKLIRKMMKYNEYHTLSHSTTSEKAPTREYSRRLFLREMEKSSSFFLFSSIEKQRKTNDEKVEYTE